MEPLVAEAGPSLYGGYDLRRGDRDALFRYGGVVRRGSEPLPRPGEVPFVTQLQRDLRELGFLLAGEPSGDFGLETEWAIREFQIYARMARRSVNACNGRPALSTGPRCFQLGDGGLPPASF